MVSAFEFQCFSLFSVKSLLICLLSWFRLSAMAENSPVESGFKGMTCSTPVNPFKLGKLFTSVWFVCWPVTKNGPSKSQISMPKPVCFARSIGKYWQCKSPISRNQHMSQEAVDTTLPKALQKLLEGSTDYLTNVRLRDCRSYWSIINMWDLGTTHVVPYRIEMDNVFPIRQQPRRTSPLKHDEFERQVTNLIQQGKVKEFVKPLVFFSPRLCVDYRQLNTLTVRDALRLPRGDYSLATLSGSWWYSTLDLLWVTGKWQWTRTPRRRQHSYFQVAFTNGMWCLSDLQRTQSIYQIDGSCFEGPTLANLFDLPWWCDSYGAYIWRRIRALETGVWATIQGRIKA